MPSFDMRPTLKTAAKILVLGALAAPYFSLAQPAFDPTPRSDRERQIVEKIHDLQSQDGPYAVDSIAPWTALSLLYEEQGLSAYAVAAIEQARQAVRVNYGLYSLEEAPLLQRTLRIEEERGNLEAAMDHEQTLLSLAKRYPDDLRTVPILEEAASKRLDVLQRYLRGEAPPQITLGCYYQGPHPWSDASLSRTTGNCFGGSRGTVIASLTTEAWVYYRAAIGVMVRNGLYSSDDLRAMEKELIRISYRSSRYNAGKQSYRRLLGYNAASSAPWLARVETFVEMTDWDLLFAQRAGTRALRDALDAYEQAYDLLETKGVERASIEKIFAPKIPVVLPTFLSNPLLSEDSGSGRYIDVAFDITKYGRSEHVDVLDTTTNATDAEQDELVRVIKRSVFRPRMTDGRIAGPSRVVVRQYLAAAPDP